MTELINNSSERKRKLKELILKLHDGESEAAVRQELLDSLRQIPYGEVMQVEQELIAEGLPTEEVLRLCDAHSAVLHGNIDLSGSKQVPPGHPVDVMINENKELNKVAAEIERLIIAIEHRDDADIPASVMQLRGLYNSLFDADKHYQRKEYLLFPFLEKQGITGPPKVMWGKHDEIRDLIKGSIELLQTEGISREDLVASSELLLLPAVRAVADMVKKEEEILLPMALDALSEADWYEVKKQSTEIGYCLYDPQIDWKPDWATTDTLQELNTTAEHIQLPSGAFSVTELMAILNTLPVDITFIDKEDKVKFFSQSAEKISQRTRAILNRDVRHCHPPASAHIVDKIVDDFKSGKASSAPFWINMGGKLIYIEYLALRSEAGDYLGTLGIPPTFQSTEIW